jgi:CRP-like cAMP-binding protein
MNDPSDGLPTRRGRQPSIKVQAFLANLPMFSEMSTQELDRVASGTQVQHAAKGDVVFRTGDPCVGFHVVVEIIRPGSSFGEALMFLDKPYIVFAQALADSMLLHVAKRTVLEELERDPGFARRMLSGLSRKLHGLVRDVEAYTLRSGAERVIGYLLRDVPDGQSEGVVEVNLSPGKSVIASRLNMTPEHFSRILHDLAVNGLIEVDGRMVRIRDLARLRGSDAPEFPVR